MKPTLVGAVIGLTVLVSLDASGNPPRRQIVCKTPEIAERCYWTHGRLGYGNGTPALRLWKIGTNRVLGIYSGPSTYNPKLEDPDMGDNEDPQLPANVKKVFRTNTDQGVPLRIFADFEVCQLEPERSGVMQAACIEAARNIVVEK